MNIQEIDSSQLPNSERPGTELSQFIFETIADSPVDAPGLAKIAQWGLEPTLKIHKFRYNLEYDDLNIKSFLVDLFNSPAFKKETCNFLPTSDSWINSVTFERLRSTLVNMNLFDKFEESDLCYQDGSIKKMWGYDVQDIEMVDKIRSSMIDEDSEEFLAFEDTDRKELLFRLLQLFVLGGKLNQYEDNLNEYKDFIKKLYKSLVNVKKDQSTNHVYIDTAFYSLKKVGPQEIFPPTQGPDHPQNICYALINKGTRSLWLLYNKWNKWGY
jgi:hypothetical protein